MITACNNIGKPQKQTVEQMKSDTKNNIFFMIQFMLSSINRQNEPVLLEVSIVVTSASNSN